MSFRRIKTKREGGRSSERRCLKHTGEECRERGTASSCWLQGRTHVLTCVFNKKKSWNRRRDSKGPDSIVREGHVTRAVV